MKSKYYVFILFMVLNLFTREILCAIEQQNDNLDYNTKYNTFGVTLGYLGVSKFGISLNGTVSPTKYTFFDLNTNIGFMTFSFNGNVNFNGFVPFNKGGWYGGIGIGGGLFNIDKINGFFNLNVITGFLFFNWLNISFTLQMELAPEFNLRYKPMIGYVYRFKPKDNDIITDNKIEPVHTKNTTLPAKQIVPYDAGYYIVEEIKGVAQYKSGETWIDLIKGDIVPDETFIRTPGNNSSLVVGKGSMTVYIPENREGLVDSFRVGYNKK